MPDSPQRSIDSDEASVLSGGDNINVGNVTGSAVAVGRGARVVVNNARTQADEAREQKKYERAELAQAMVDMAEKLEAKHNRPTDFGRNPYKNLLQN